MEYQEVYRWGASQLAEAGIEEASLDARLLLEEICGTDRNFLLVHGKEQVSGEKYEDYVKYIALRKSHIPLQQIVGYQEFMGLKFKVTPDVLIPRQDTEILVEEVMRYLHDGMHILDMCTGSGCILLSLLRYSNDCAGTGCDISQKALEVARENADALGLKASFVQSDLFETVNDKYEFIVSNPPYIPTDVIPALMEEVKNHEPLTALDGREDGLYFYRRIVKEAKEHLYPGGMLFFEIGWDQAQAVSALMEEAGYQEVTVCKDLAGLDRVVYGLYG
ncbi:MAG: peptide chain release factor N(5)-glutamine methyltransferase [Lachnospiraceae bacterium]|nr:peptide chain release factor N(5)-glutamine methyltransferase [Lachnospiraceae bacterium]